MKTAKKFISLFLIVILIMQGTVFTAFANASSTHTVQVKEGVVFRQNADGTITATIRTSPSTEQIPVPNPEDSFQDCGDRYRNLSEDVSVTLQKSFTGGRTLVSIVCTWGSLSFFPEMISETFHDDTPDGEQLPTEKDSETEGSPIGSEVVSPKAEEAVPEPDENAEADSLRTFEPEEDAEAEIQEQPIPVIDRETAPEETTDDPVETADENEGPILFGFSQKRHIHLAPYSYRGFKLIRRLSKRVGDCVFSEPSQTFPTTERAEPTALTEEPEPADQEPTEPECPEPTEPESPELTDQEPTESVSPELTDADLTEPESPELEEAEEPVVLETSAPIREEFPLSTDAPEATEAEPAEAEEYNSCEETEPVPETTDTLEETTAHKDNTESAFDSFYEDKTSPAQTSDAQNQSSAAFGSVTAVGKDYHNGVYNTILYPSAINAYSDLEFVPTGNGIKESVVMRQYTTSVISYIMEFDGLIPELSGSKILLLNASGQKVGEISAPYLLDANGAYNDRIAVSLERIGDYYRLVYRMDEAWLKAAAYPVVLDPTTYIGVDDNGHSWSLMEDGYVTSAEPGRNYGYTNQHIKCGNTMGEAFCLFRPVIPDSINEIADHLLVKEVKLHTYVESVTGTNKYTAYQLMGDWSSRTVTYNNCPAYMSADATSHTISSTGWYTWDITPIASTWFNSMSQMQEYGVLIRGQTSGGWLVFTSSDASRNNAYYEITYYPRPDDVNLSLSPEGNALNSGTGYLDLIWDPVEGASNYYVGIHNGKSYQYFYVEGASSWTTKGKGIWPTEAEINDGKYLLHTDGSGAELPTIPAFSYNNSGGELAGNVNYALCVIPANQYGQAPNPKYYGVKTARLPDRLPPSTASSLSIEPDVYTNAETLTLTWAGIRDYNDTDTSAVSSLGTGCVQYALNGSNNWIDTQVSAGDGSANIVVSGAADGQNYISVRAMDSAGNTSASQFLYFYIDRTPPTAPELSVVPEGWSSADSLSFTWSGISDLNELSRVEYSVDGGAYVSTGISDPSYSGYMLDLTALEDGVHTLRVRGVDIVGNTGAAAEIAFCRDTVSPAVDGAAVDPDSWTKDDTVSFGWTALQDVHSGLRLVWYSVDNGEQIELAAEESLLTELDISGLEDGAYTILLHFEDAAGNVTEKTLTVLRDVTAPELALLTPPDGSAVNGTVDVTGSVRDLSLSSWQLLAWTEDGESRILAEGSSEADAELLGVFNTALYEDGAKVELKLYAIDQAGNETEVAGTVIIVDKSAVPVTGTVAVTSPGNGEQLSVPAMTGSYSPSYESPEIEGLLYIDGVYQGGTAEGSFAFDPIVYEENTNHSISVLSRAEDGTLQFSEGLSSYVLFSDGFEDDGFLASSEGIRFDHGASLSGSGGSFVTQTISPAFPLLSLRLSVTEETPAGTGIRYYYSTDDGETWTGLQPDTDVPMLSRPEGVALRAELIGNGSASPVLHGLTLSGVIETSPTRVTVKLLRPVQQLQLSDQTVSQAITTLAEAPTDADLLLQYWIGVLRSGSFRFDARSVPENGSRNVALAVETEDGEFWGTGAEAAVLLRESVTPSDVVTSDALQADGKLYAIRLEALYTGDTAFACSTDDETWIPLTPGSYCLLDQAADTVRIRAEGGELLAWHVEGVTCEESTVSVKILRAPENVTAADYGASYYANEELRYYQLSWQDPTPNDSTASYTTEYQIYRNGKLIAATANKRYTDNNYTANARYEVRTVRVYSGFGERYSDRTAASVTRMKAPERVIGVENTAEEQSQSEYLNNLYGGDYTFSNEAKAPSDNRALDLSLLGRNKICANGFEPINFNTGNYLLEAADYRQTDLGIAVLTLDRTYNSKSHAKNGPFGARWSSTWSEHLRLYRKGDVVYTAADGAEVTFALRPNGVYVGGESRGLTLTAEGNEFRVTDLNGEIHAFIGTGLLKYIRWSDGNAITVERDKNGLIKSLHLPSGETLEVKMDKRGHITAIETASGTLRYSYKGNNLVSFTDTDGSEIRYVYDGAGRMTAWYDAAGERQVKNTYDEENRVIRQIDANGGVYEVQYEEDHTVTKDADGNVSEIWFDEQFRTTKTVDANGAEIGYEYDLNNNIVAITDALGNTTRYEYDDAGNKTRILAPDGTCFSMQYDENNNLVASCNPLGAVTRYAYDDNDRLVKQTNPDGGEVTYTYNDAGQVLTTADPVGAVIVYEYEGTDLIRSTDPNGNTTSYAYDELHRLSAVTDALGSTTSLTYDEKGNLVCVVYPDGSSVSNTYDKVGNLISETDALGNVTRYEYDAMSQLVKLILPDGSEFVSTYDKSGNIVSTVDPAGNRTDAAYNGRGWLTAQTDTLGNTTSYSYDLNGRIAAQTLPNGAQTQYRYTVNGKLASTINALGEETTYTYDAAGNLAEITLPDGSGMRYEYDVMGRILSETDANGAVTTYTYDKVGRILSVTDALGGTTSYTYDANGNLLTETDALGGVTSYVYDALDRVVSMTDACGAETRYAYDVVDNLISRTDALGNATTYAYDNGGRTTELTDVLGAKSAMRYDSLGNVIEVLQKNGGTEHAVYDPLGQLLSGTDALGNTTSYEYDANGRLQKITDAIGQCTEMFYDEVGNLTRVSLPDGNSKTCAYDLAGRLVSEISAAGAETEYHYESGRIASISINGNAASYEYDPAGNITAMTDAEGRKAEMTYDLLGNLLTLRYADGSTERYEYDALSRIIKHTPREGDVTEYTYNAMGDVLTISEGGRTTSYEYDILGRLTATVTADGARTEMEYDALGNVVRIENALGSAISYSYTPDSLVREIRAANGAVLKSDYDLTGNQISRTDPEGAVTVYAYDPLGRRTAATDALGNTTRYEYDAADNLIRVIDALGHTTDYTYNANGDMTSETDALGNTVAYRYTSEGWLESVTDAEGRVTRYTYDRTGSVLSVDHAGEQTETNTYNELGLLTVVTTKEGETRFQYDGASRLLSVTQPNGETVSYTYDSHGNRSSMTYPNGKTAVYSYNDMDRLISVKGVDGSTTRYSYDALGRRIATKGTRENVVYAYDEVGNLVSQTATGLYELSLEYAYDRAGRLTEERRSENGEALTSSYTYDALGQLTGFSRSDGLAESYVYDPVGNMTAKTVNGVRTTMDYNAVNQLTASVTGGAATGYTYDANGNLVRSESADGARTYAYNALGLLKQFTREDGYSESYAYNVNGLLRSVSTSEGETSEFTWDILRGDGTLISAQQNGETTCYSYGLEQISSLSGQSRTEFVYDGRGSVAAELSYENSWRGLLESFTNAQITAKHYTPFGSQIGEETGGFGYNGESYNAETGMIYLRARFYEPELDRFSQKDRKYSGVNEYAYCRNNPVLYADSSGLEELVISGGNYNGEGDKENAYNFITTGLRDVELLRQKNEQEGKDEKITWIIADAGWTPEQKQAIIESAGEDINVQFITSSDELTQYINNRTYDEKTGEVDRISYIAVYSHGMYEGKLGREDANTIRLGLHTDKDKDLTLNIQTVSNWDRDAFSTVESAAIKLYSCKSFYNRYSNTLAYTIAKQTGVDTYAYSGRSDYQYTLVVNKPRDITRLIHRLYEAERANNPSPYFDQPPAPWTVAYALLPSATKTYYENNPLTDMFYNYIKNKIILPSVYGPMASQVDSKAYVVHPDGTSQKIDKIPDLADKYQTGYIEPTPTKIVAGITDAVISKLKNKAKEVQQYVNNRQNAMHSPS